MVLIWIRHAEKLYNNEKGPPNSKQHDPGIILDEETMIHIDTLVEELIKKYGKPNRIITSPFLRTRQTSKLITEVLNVKYKIDVNIDTDIKIAEYLGFCNKDGKYNYADLEEETIQYFPSKVSLNENLISLHIRVENHINELYNSKENIWILTHGIVMCKIYEKLFNGKLRRPEPLSYFAF
jgi:broad specificity phosphatase PhoE